MKRLLFSTLLALLSFALPAQSSVVYGIYRPTTTVVTDYTLIAGVDPLTADILDIDTVLGFDAIALGTSDFDQQLGTYKYLGASMTGPFAWVSYNVLADQQTSALSADGLNAVEYDMATGISYGLGFISTNNGMDYITTFEALDYETGNQFEISQLPSIEGVVLGATCFDPVNGIYYLYGIVSGQGGRLIGIEAQSGEIVSSVSIDLGPTSNINDIRYDIANEMFYAIHRVGQSSVRIASITPQGQLTDLVDVTGLAPAITPGASVYHQETGRYIFMGIGLNNAVSRLITVDVQQAEVIASPIIDYSLIELQIDNISFAQANFTSLDEYTILDFGLSPNPVASGSEFVLIADEENGPMTYRLIDITGRVVRSGQCLSGAPLSTSGLTSGLYLLELETATGARGVQRLVVD